MRRLLTNGKVLGGVVLVGVLIAVVLWPRTVVVETARVSRGGMMQTIDEEGTTRVRHKFVVSAPLAGRLLRVDLEPGDRVRQGEVVARLRAEAPPLLDDRSRAEAVAAAETARAAIGRAKAEEKRARTDLAQAQRELTRIRQLAATGVVSTQNLDTAESSVTAAQDAVDAAVFAVRASEAELRRAEARTLQATSSTGRVFTITAPVDGVVLRRLRESETVVPAGEPILEVGDPKRLEIVSDLLSTDAVRVRPGSRAIIDQWGGQRTLEALVRRVEPAGFTKISALGVEEQRVNVILDFHDPSEAFKALGDAYRVEVRIVLWEAADVLKVPGGALFREGSDWAAYAVAEGHARKVRVEAGHQTGQEAEVLSGLSEGQLVVLHPPDSLTDGARVSDRSAGSP